MDQVGWARTEVKRTLSFLEGWVIGNVKNGQLLDNVLGKAPQDALFW